MNISILKGLPGTGETTLTALVMNCFARRDNYRIEFVAEDRVMKGSEPGELEGDGFRKWIDDFDQDPWIRGRDFSDLQNFDLPKKPDYFKNFPWWHGNRQHLNSIFCEPDTHYFLSLGLNRRATDIEICVASKVSDLVLIPVVSEKDRIKITGGLLNHHLSLALKADIINLNSIFIAIYDPCKGNPVSFHTGFNRYDFVNIRNYDPTKNVSEMPREHIDIFEEISNS